MIPTMIHDAELPLTKEDCLEYLGPDRFDFCLRRGRGQRIGQAWVNSLCNDDYSKLWRSAYDPFIYDDWFYVIRALQFLLEN